MFARMSELLALHSFPNAMKKSDWVGVKGFSVKEAVNHQERMSLAKRVMESASTMKALITLLGSAKKKKASQDLEIYKVLY